MNFKNLNLKKFKTKKSLIFIIIVVVVIIAGYGVYSFTKTKEVDVKQEIKNVSPEKITLGSISTNVEYAGSLKAVKEVIVSSKSEGKITSVNVNVGDMVTVGQVLYTLDKEELQVNLQAQQAALDVANAELEKTDSGLAQQISQAEQDYGKAQIQFSSLEDNYNKMRVLYEAEAVSKKEFDDSKNQYDNASIDLKTTKDNLSLLKNKALPQSTISEVAKVEQAQAGVNSAQIQINNATITSPISGVVSEKDVEVGKLASTQSGTVTVIDSSTVIAEITVPDTMIGKITVGQPVPITINALEDKKITAVIDTISPATNSKDNCYMVKAEIDNSNGDMRSGMFVKVSLQADRKDNVLIVPNQAIKTENSLDYLYLVEDSKIKKVSVETGISNDQFTEVSGNVQQSEDIITEGQSILADGETVNIVQ